MVLKFNNSANYTEIPYFKRKLLETIGLFLLTVSIAVAVSIITFDINDPSFSYLTDKNVNNVFGKYGAYTSDILIKFFGAGSVLIFLTGFVWGLKLFIHKKITFFWLRLIFLPITLITASIALNTDNIFNSNLEGGGIVGKYTYLYIINYLEYINFEINQIYIAIFFFSISFFCFNFTLGLNQSDWIKVSNFIFLVVKYLSSLFVKLFNLILVFINKTYYFLKPIIFKILNKNTDIKSSSNSDDLFSEKKNYSKPGKLLKESVEPKFNFGKETDYELPKLDLLEEAVKNIHTGKNNKDLLQQNAKLLENVIKEYKFDAKVIGIHPGPIVTLYELEPAPGIQTKKIINLTDDIARSMSAESARISNVRNKNAVGVELPNQERETVNLKEIFGLKDFDATNSTLPLVFGKDISGKPVIQDLSKMPHLLIAGTTGSGKSVCINTIILSLLYRHSPEKCKFILIDPKMLELSTYEGIPHLLCPVITEAKRAASVLGWVVKEMESRYKLMTRVGVRNIEGYNLKHKLPMPYIVVVVDEMSDLMLVAGKEIEGYIQKLSQMARAAGIHIIMATQRPSVDVITGTIKANFPTRISFQVTSKIDSRTILGEQGAEQLLGKGDMLYMSSANKTVRIHAPFVSENEIEKINNYLRSQAEPDYVDEILSFADEKEIGQNLSENENQDELYKSALELVKSEGKASTSFLQRKLQIGYNRAARIIDMMEVNGEVSKANHVGKRELLK